MEVLYERCCGLDIHKASIAACLITPGPDGQPHKEIRSFGTLTTEMLALGDWLGEAGCTHLAMESTGVYWKPLYNLLEERFTLILANARHIKAVPGRKTDVRDCEWIADLLRHGLLRASCVPDRPQRELRELTRYRTSLIRERADEANRLQKTLEGANIKLSSVVSDVLGQAARALLEALIAGETDIAALVERARGRLTAPPEQLQQALTGRVGAHQRFLLREQLQHIDALAASIERVSAEIAERLRPFAEELALLDTLPGVGQRTAEVLVAEIGTDMDRFPTADHLASWGGMSPGNNESAGKRKSGRTRKGSPWLRSALVEAAQAARRKRDSYPAAQFARIAARRGSKRAAVAVGHSLLVMAYHILREHTPYEEVGDRYFHDQRSKRREQRLVQQLRALGYTVTPKAAA